MLGSGERQHLKVSQALGGAVANQGTNDVCPAASDQLLLDGIIHLQPHRVVLIREQQLHHLF